MALTQITDVYVPAVYNSLTSVNSPELTAYFTSGVAVRNPAIDGAFANGGRTIDLPFWKDIDSSIEPNYSTDNATDIAVPNKVVTGVMTGRIAQMNQSFSSADLAAELAGSDPLQHVRNRFGTYWTKRWQKRVLAVTLGVLNANIAQNSGDMVNNIALETTVGVTSANLFSRAAFTGAAFTAGDQFDQFVAIAVHSIVYKRMVDNDDITFIIPSDGSMQIPTFLGKRVIVDDSMPVIAGSTSGFKYVSVLFGPGFIGYGENTPLNPTYVKREELQGNGGGVEIIGERKSLIVHPFGHTFTSNTVTGGYSPSNANLMLAANWQRILERKLIPVAFLITNG
jgi:hypothetical protein